MAAFDKLALSSFITLIVTVLVLVIELIARYKSLTEKYNKSHRFFMVVGTIIVLSLLAGIGLDGLVVFNKNEEKTTKRNMMYLGLVVSLLGMLYYLITIRTFSVSGGKSSTQECMMKMFLIYFAVCLMSVTATFHVATILSYTD